MLTADDGMAIEVLLVEDDPGDVLLTQEGLEQSKVLHHLTVVPDGEAALDHLRSVSPKPALVFLDLYLPRLGGREVLRQIRADASMGDVRVVILTTSKSEEERLRASALGADGYVRKPVGLESFVEVVRQIGEFFFGVVRADPWADAG